MTRWYQLEPVDAGFFDTAPHVMRFDVHLASPPERVWESLASEASIRDWSPLVSALQWTAPRGPDTSREITLLRAIRVRERFFRWDEGRGYSFYADRMTIPALRRFAEDYVVAPDGAGAVLTWRIALEAKPAFALPTRLLAPINRATFGKLASDGRRFFAREQDGAAA